MGATRRSSIYEGISGYSIYTSIGEGLDQITYGNRTSRRNSISDNTVSANYSLSRQSSFSTRNSVPISALMASIEANKVQREDTSSQANSNYGYQNGFGQNNNHEERKSVSMQEQQSNNNHSYQPAPLQRQESEAKVGKKDKKDKPKRTKEEKEQRKIEKEQRRQRKAKKQL